MVEDEEDEHFGMEEYELGEEEDDDEFCWKSSKTTMGSTRIKATCVPGPY